MCSHFDITKKEKINKNIYSLVSTVNEKINLGYFIIVQVGYSIF